MESCPLLILLPRSRAHSRLIPTYPTTRHGHPQPTQPRCHLFVSATIQPRISTGGHESGIYPSCGPQEPPPTECGLCCRWKVRVKRLSGKSSTSGPFWRVEREPARLRGTSGYHWIQRIKIVPSTTSPPNSGFSYRLQHVPSTSLEYWEPETSSLAEHQRLYGEKKDTIRLRASN